jgi:soluble lytic murein transglycosylase-like protein
MNNPPVEKVKKDRKFYLLLALIISGLMVLCVLGLVLLFGLQRELKDIKSTQKESHVNQIRTNQLLLSSMDWSTRRQKYILFMRDMILAEWKRIGEKNVDISKAYNYSEIIMRNVENFPNIDPSLILSMACVESAFGEKATSPKGAAGMLQIMPYTARPYFELYGLPYSDSALYQPPINLKIGIKLLADILASCHSVETSIAVYNGGKWGLNYPDLMDKVPDETKRYVPCVVAKWKEYKDLYETYHVDSLMMKHDSVQTKTKIRKA